MLINNPPHLISNSRGQHLVLLIFVLLTFLQWSPPGFSTLLSSFRWYFMLGVSGFVFLFHGRFIKPPIAKFYILFNVLVWLGSLLSLFRTPLPDQVLYNVVSLIFPFSLGLVFIPTLSTDKGKLVWIGTLMLAAVWWGVNVVSLWLQQGENIRYTLAGKEMDHNMISLCLALAATASMVVALYDAPTIRGTKRKLLKFFGWLASIVFTAITFLTYSRSGFIVTAISILFVTLTLIFTKQAKKFIFILSISLIGFSLIIPIVQINNPIWFSKFDEVSRLGDSDTSVYVRTVLVRKAWRLIQENPIIGVGPEVFRTIYDPTMGRQSFYMTHNTYLATWVEKGIIGLAGFVIWVYLWIRMFLTRWNNFGLTERIIMSTFVPFFIMLFFLDIGGLFFIFMLTLFSVLFQAA